MRLCSRGKIFDKEWGTSEEIKIKSPLTLKYLPLGQCAILIKGITSFNRYDSNLLSLRISFSFFILSFSCLLEELGFLKMHFFFNSCMKLLGKLANLNLSLWLLFGNLSIFISSKQRLHTYSPSTLLFKSLLLLIRNFLIFALLNEDAALQYCKLLYCKQLEQTTSNPVSVANVSHFMFFR